MSQSYPQDLLYSFMILYNFSLDYIQKQIFVSFCSWFVLYSLLKCFLLQMYSKKIWATFPRQEEAIKFAKEHAQIQIFSYQDHFKGQRRFLVSTYHEFWRRLFSCIINPCSLPIVKTIKVLHCITTPFHKLVFFS